MGTSKLLTVVSPLLKRNSTEPKKDSASPSPSSKKLKRLPTRAKEAARSLKTAPSRTKKDSNSKKSNLTKPRTSPKMLTANTRKLPVNWSWLKLTWNVGKNVLNSLKANPTKPKKNLSPSPTTLRTLKPEPNSPKRPLSSSRRTLTNLKITSTPKSARSEVSKKIWTTPFKELAIY